MILPFHYTEKNVWAPVVLEQRLFLSGSKHRQTVCQSPISTEVQDVRDFPTPVTYSLEYSQRFQLWAAALRTTHHQMAEDYHTTTMGSAAKRVKKPPLDFAVNGNFFSNENDLGMGNNSLYNTQKCSFSFFICKFRYEISCLWLGSLKLSLL